jgi:hypothetical protein
MELGRGMMFNRKISQASPLKNWRPYLMRFKEVISKLVGINTLFTGFLVLCSDVYTTLLQKSGHKIKL